MDGSRFSTTNLPATQLPSGSDLNCWDNCYSHSEDFSDHLHWHRSGSCNPLVCATNNPRLFSKRYTYLDCLSGHHRGTRLASATDNIGTSPSCWHATVHLRHVHVATKCSLSVLARRHFNGGTRARRLFGCAVPAEIRSSARAPACLDRILVQQRFRERQSELDAIHVSLRYSRVQGATGPGMPKIDDAVRQSVQRQPFIGILARSDKEVDDAYSALKTIPINFIEIARANYSAAFKSYVVTIVKLTPVAPPS